MNIAIVDTEIKRLFSLFPSLVEEFRDCMRVYASDIDCTPDNERETPVFLSKQRYVTNMQSIINVSNELLETLEDYSGDINDGSACIDLMRGLIIYGANRRKEVERAVKSASGKSFIVNDNRAVNVYGSSLFGEPKDDCTDKIEDLTYIFDSSIEQTTMRTQFHTSMLRGIKALKQLAEDGDKIEEMKSVSPELHTATQDIRAIASIFYNTHDWARAFAIKHEDTYDDYKIYQYFFLFYASFARKLYANYWQYRVENHDALNIRSRLTACLK